MSSSESEDDIGGFCKHCSKNCDSLHTFLRHVSHSKLCKLSYEESFLDKLKKKAKILSKRKFYKSLSKSEKKRRYDQEKDWRRANAKKRYVAKWKFTTDEGRAFDNIFKQKFDIASKETESRLQDMAKKVEYLDMISIDKTMDFVFKDGLDELIKTDCFTEEEFDCDKIEAFFDEKFEEKLPKLKNDEQECWSAQALDEILEKFYFPTLTKAYLEHFNDDFKDLFSKTKESSMDKVFSNIEDVEMEDIPEEQDGSFYHFLGLAISNSVSSTHKNEMIKKCEENGLSSKLLDLIRRQFSAKMKRNKLVKDYI